MLYEVITRSFNIQRRRQGYPGQFRELDLMNAIPAARKQPNKAKPDREADPRAKTRANPRCNCARTGHTHARAKRCAGRKRASGATPKTRFGDARATRVYENAFCRTLFILFRITSYNVCYTKLLRTFIFEVRFRRVVFGSIGGLRRNNFV